MQLSLKVAVDLYNGKDIDYLLEDESAVNTSSDICKFPSGAEESKLPFARELYDYCQSRIEVFKKIEEPNERQTRQELYTIESAETAEYQYIQHFLECCG